MNTLLLIDGNGLLHRSFHALPAFTTKEGVQTNAVYGFATMLFRAIADFRPTHIAVCFDTPVPTFRKKIFKEYQIHRPKIIDALKSQFPLARAFLDAAHIRYFEKEGYEADDVIGTIVKKINQKMRTFILTADRDMMQLVNESVSIIVPQTGLSEIKLYTIEETIKKFLVAPSQIPDLKSLTGDPADNYKGADGIGPKTAAQLLIRFKTLQGIYDNLDDIGNERIKNSLLQHKEHALLSQRLATIVSDVPIDFDMKTCYFEGYNESLKNFFLKMEFHTLIKRFFGSGKKKTGEKNAKKQLGLF